jgi:hypothetical protein
MRTFPLALLAAFAMPAVAGDYTTMGTFTMVSNCMIEAGGQTEENLYMCSCRADVIKAEFSEPDYEDALTVEKYRELPADKGAVFRDSKKGQQLLETLKKVRRKATEQCPAIRTVTGEPKSIERK